MNELSPSLHWLKWRLGSVWPSKGFPSSSLTKGDTDAILSAMVELSAQDPPGTDDGPQLPKASQKESDAPEGQLKVVVIDASNIPFNESSNKGATAFSTVEGYCRVTLGNSSQRTSTQKGGKGGREQSWAESFEFGVKSLLYDELVLELVSSVDGSVISRSESRIFLQDLIGALLPHDFQIESQ